MISTLFSCAGSFVFQAVVDRLKAPTVTIDTERSDETGGIDIERAKQRMKQEDAVDREIYRQKIKQRHRVRIFNGSAIGTRTCTCMYICHTCVRQLSVQVSVVHLSVYFCPP